MADPVEPHPSAPLIDSYTYSSPLPPKDVADVEKQGGEGWMMGIDEAGRGPVLGPMVYAAAFCPMSYKKTLEGLGFDDSKALSLIQRAHLFSLFSTPAEPKQLCYMSSVLSPQDISRDMLRRVPFNLNRQAEEATISLIRDTLARGVPLSEVYVDALGPAPQWQERLSRIFPTLTFDVRPKADSIFKIVGAASIIAKVTRDRLIEGWIHPEGSSLPRKLVLRPVLADEGKAKKEKARAGQKGSTKSKRKRGRASMEFEDEEDLHTIEAEDADQSTQGSNSRPASKRPRLEEFGSENLEDPTIAGVEALVAAVDASDAIMGTPGDTGAKRNVGEEDDLYEELGSGYPSDPRTQEYLKQAFHPIFGFPSIARFSWAGVKIAMDKDGVGCKWIDDQIVRDKMTFFDPGADNAKPKIWKDIGLDSVGEL